MADKIKKEQFIPIEFEIQRDLLKRIINSHKKFVSHHECNSLSCFHFELVQNKMKVYTTDGNRALKSVLEINNISKKDINFNIESALIEKLVIFKSQFPCISVTVDNDTISFNDGFSGVIQTYKLMKHIFPDVEKILQGYDYKKQNYVIGLNRAFFNDLSALQVNERTNIIQINMNKKDNLQPVLVKTGSTELEQTALLMPVKIRE